MANRILLGIDLGTTVLKVCAIEGEGGELLARGSRRLDVRTLPGGGREQDLYQIDRSLRSVVEELREALGADWGKISGIGLSAQGGSSIIVDRTTGQPLIPMILWNDARAQGHTARLARQLPPEGWRAQLLCDVPPHGLGRLAWLRETRPDLFGPRNLHVGAGEYLFFHLTGVWRQDPGNAIQVGSYNAVRRELQDDLFDLIGIPLSFVAPLRRHQETAPLSPGGGRTLMLPGGVPVTGPYLDQEAGYLSAAGITKQPLQCSLGTAWVGNFILPDDTTGSSPFQLVLPAPVAEGRLVVQPLLTGNIAWDWGLEQLLGPPESHPLLCAAEILKESLLPARGLLALPWFGQPNPLQPSLPGGGAFFGLTPVTDRAELLRALAASLTFELARVLESVKRIRAVDSVVLTGGASRGIFFRQLIAALFGPLPVYCQNEEGSAPARGALFPLGAEAARIRTRLEPPPPDALAAEIRNRYGSYLELFQRLFESVPAGEPFRFREEGS